MLPYLVYPVVALTAIVIIALPAERRLGPIALLGGVHVIYNLMSILLSQGPYKIVQYMCTIAAFAAFAGGVLIAARLPRPPLRSPLGAEVPAAPTELLGDDQGEARRTSIVARIQHHRRALTSDNRKMSIERLDIRPAAFYALFLIAITTYGYLVYRAGGLPIFQTNPNGARLTFLINGYFSTIVFVGLVGCAVAGGIATLSSVSRNRKPVAEPLVVLISLTALTATGNRGMLFYPVLALALYSLLRFRVRLAYILGFAILGIVAFSVSGYFRNKAAFGPTYDEDLAIAGYPGVLKYLGPVGSYIGGSAETFARTLDVFPQHLPFAMGTQFFSPLLHKESVDLYLKEVFNLEFEGYGLALGAMNAFYLDFGWPGVVVGFFLMGSLAGYVYLLAVTRGGRFVPAYVLVCANLLLANYGHPFAYVATVAAPLVIIALLAPAHDGRSSKWVNFRRGTTAVPTGSTPAGDHRARTRSR